MEANVIRICVACHGMGKSSQGTACLACNGEGHNGFWVRSISEAFKARKAQKEQGK